MLTSPCTRVLAQSFLLFVLTVASTLLFGQTEIIPDGQEYTVSASGSYQDFIIPANTPANTSRIDFTLRGADGGRGVTPGGCTANGGEGATIAFSLEIGDENSSFRPGTRLRFVTGVRGNERGFLASGGGDGGGGSAVYFTNGDEDSGIETNEPDINFSTSENNWVLIGLAGGGGGGFRVQTVFCYDPSAGQGGRAERNLETSGGSASTDAFSGDFLTNGGGGLLSDGQGFTDGKGKAGLATGDVINLQATTSTRYSYGSGSGGAGTADGGGGGGGIKGGNAQETLTGGKGGESFYTINAINVEATAGGSTGNPSDGYITYRFFANRAPVAKCRGVVLITETDANNIELQPEDIDDGTYSPSNTPFTLSTAELGCDELSIGHSRLVSLIVTDENGLADTCSTTLSYNPDYDGMANVLSQSTVAYSGEYEDLYIPEDYSLESLTFTLNGGDGGKAKRVSAPCSTIDNRGGYGAKVEVRYNVGCEEGDLEPGGSLRFIIGGKGSSQTISDGVLCGGSATGGGGGGTGILYREPGGCDWQILAIAGGGGGATAETSVYPRGQDGVHEQDSFFIMSWGDFTEDWDNVNNSAEPGQGGLNGTILFDSYIGAGGGGAFDNGDSFTCSLESGGGAGFPSGGYGGYDRNGCTDARHGGFGFGGGGAGLDRGGGGGGYTGGAHKGGGGASYGDPDFNVTLVSLNAEAYSGNPADGYINVQPTSSSGPTITVTCPDVTVTLDESGEAEVHALELATISTSDGCENGFFYGLDAAFPSRIVDCNHITDGLDVEVKIYRNTSLPVATCMVHINVVSADGPSMSCPNFQSLLINNDGTPDLDALYDASNVSFICASRSELTPSLYFNFTEEEPSPDFYCENLGENVQLEWTVTAVDGTSTICRPVLYPNYGELDLAAITCADQTVVLDGTGTGSLNTATVVVPNFVDCFIESYSEETLEFNCFDLGTYPATITVTMKEGHQLSCTFNVTTEASSGNVCTINPPDNDDVANAFSLDFSNGGVYADIIEGGRFQWAGTENSELNCYDVERSAWYTYTPGSNETVTFTVENTDGTEVAESDLFVALYRGFGVHPLTEEVCVLENTDGIPDQYLRIGLDAGVTYYYRVATIRDNTPVDVTVTASRGNNVWTGSVSDDWATGDNWTWGRSPKLGESCFLTSSHTFEPVIHTGTMAEAHYLKATSNSLTIEEGGRLTMSAGNAGIEMSRSGAQLTVAGELIIIDPATGAALETNTSNGLLITETGYLEITSSVPDFLQTALELNTATTINGALLIDGPVVGILSKTPSGLSIGETASVTIQNTTAAAYQAYGTTVVNGHLILLANAGDGIVRANGVNTASRLTVSDGGQVTVREQGGTVLVDMLITNDGTISIDDATEGLDLEGAAGNLSGDIVGCTNNGTFEFSDISGTIFLSGTFLSTPGSVFMGEGLVGSGCTFEAGSEVHPGSSPGCLTFGEDVDLSGVVIALEIEGTTACTDFDVINFAQEGTLANAELSLSGAYVPVHGDEFLVLNKENGSFSGQFSGLPEGSTVALNGVDLIVSYLRGDGNDLVLTVSDALPVELLSFNGEGLDKTNLLSWSVANEEAFSHYEIERSSTDGWAYLGEVAGAGQVEGARTYSFIDEQPHLRSYYRLKMIDLDGVFAYSNVVYLKREENTELLVYPNPSNGKFTLELPVDEVRNIVLYDLTGRKVWTEDLLAQSRSSQSWRPYSQTKAGVYLLVVTGVDGAKWTKRIVIQ